VDRDVTSLVAAGLLAGFVEFLPRRCRLAFGDYFLAPTPVDGLRDRPPRAIRHSEQSEPDGTKFAQRKDETVTVLILVALRVAIA
jgi:hypothetical protein